VQLAWPSHEKAQRREQKKLAKGKDGENPNSPPIDPALDPTIDWSYQNEIELDRP